MISALKVNTCCGEWEKASFWCRSALTALLRHSQGIPHQQVPFEPRPQGPREANHAIGRKTLPGPTEHSGAAAPAGILEAGTN